MKENKFLQEKTRKEISTRKKREGREKINLMKVYI